MRKMRYNVSMTVAVLGLSVLAACSKPAAPAGDAASSGAAVASGAPAAAVANSGLGQGLKTGAWEMTNHLPGVPQPMVSKMCLDAGLSTRFAELASSNPAKLDCTTTKASRLGNAVDVESVCKDKNVTMHTKMHMEMTGDNAYHQTLEQSYDPPISQPIVSSIDGKYLGDCGDMKPGDMVMPGGIKFNMYDVAAKAKKP